MQCALSVTRWYNLPSIRPPPPLCASLFMTVVRWHLLTLADPCECALHCAGLDDAPPSSSPSKVMVESMARWTFVCYGSQTALQDAEDFPHGRCVVCTLFDINLAVRFCQVCARVGRHTDSESVSPIRIAPPSHRDPPSTTTSSHHVVVSLASCLLSLTSNRYGACCVAVPCWMRQVIVPVLVRLHGAYGAVPSCRTSLRELG